MKCCVLRCKSVTSFRPKPLTFHRFPKDPDLRRKWISAVCRDPSWAPSKYSSVCSEHFGARDFMTGIKAIGRLKPKAVPSLSVNHDSVNEIAAKECAMGTDSMDVAQSEERACGTSTDTETCSLEPETDPHIFVGPM
ncbi:THAP domain-containing protein 6 [Rhipicephalus sanguineus]|uniref:THAP domain-containing protein 6 n=1 Tax=Rhipicephalus sanguineus TaxID=34632 RepID=UPI0020C3F61E|nr:THAP domain-containing protein 6 [Rhipicephalus sanguineus]